MRWAVRALRRTGWGVADQALSSLTNFAAGILVARALGARDFGAFGIAFATYVIALGATGSLGPDPLIVRYSGVARAEWRRAARDSTGSVVAVGTALAAGCAAFGMAAHGPLRSALLALAPCLPGLMLQDAWRGTFFAAGRGRSAFANDLAWALLLVPALVAVSATGRTSVFWLTLAWGASGAAAGVVGMAQARVAPSPGRAVEWLRRHRDLAPRFLAESMALTGSTQLTFYLVGALVGLATVGAIRGAQVLLGPAYVFAIGVRLAILPEAVAMARGRVASLLRSCVALSAALGAGIALWGAAWSALPARLGADLLGPTWGPARRVLVPVTLVYASGAVILGATTGLRALAAARRSLRARLVVSVAQVGGAVAGAVAGGMVAAAWGLGLAGALGAAVFWRELLGAVRDARATAGQVETGTGATAGQAETEAAGDAPSAGPAGRAGGAGQPEPEAATAAAGPR
jgi:O-antigen/teichoic acid export membrane protein